MTLDVTIGKIRGAEPYSGGDIRIPNADKFDEDEGDYLIDVEEMPPERAGGKSTRSLSVFDAFDFFEIMMPEVYARMRLRPADTGIEVTYLQPIISEINALPDDVGISINGIEYSAPLGSRWKDRMTWLKYWANRAVEEYGPLAGISFS